MPGIHREDEPVEEAAAVPAGTAKEAVEVGREPHDPEMLGEGGGRRGVCAVDLAGPEGAPALSRAEARPAPMLAPRAVQRDGDGEGVAAEPRHVAEFGPPEPASGREERQGLDQRRLARPVLAR